MYTMEELAENVDRQCKMIRECQLPAPLKEAGLPPGYIEASEDTD